MGPGPLEVVPGFVGFVGLLVGLGVGGVESPGDQFVIFFLWVVEVFQLSHTSREGGSDVSDPDVRELDAGAWEVRLHV